MAKIRKQKSKMVQYVEDWQDNTNGETLRLHALALPSTSNSGGGWCCTGVQTLPAR